MTRHNHADANAKEIREWMRAAGAWVCTMPPEAGFDLLVAWRGNLLAVEVKDGRKVQSRRQLTEHEQDVRTAFWQRGLAYHVVESIDDAAELLAKTGS